MNKNKLVLIFGFFSVLTFSIWKICDINIQEFRKNLISNVKFDVKNKIRNKEALPETVDFEKTSYRVKYTLNNEFQDYVKKLLKKYRSDYSVVVVVDNNTGKLISAVTYDKNNNTAKLDDMAFVSTHPSASMFKIVTSAALIENTDVNSETVFNYRGKGTTLYRYQLKNKITRWTRFLNFGRAFALSNNVVFGKAAIEKVTGTMIYKMAEKFGFNKNIMADLDFGGSVFKMPQTQYHLAELASGFNDETNINPVHAAMLSSIVANDGNLLRPSLIEEIASEDEIVFSSKIEKEKTISKDTSLQLQELMENAANKGTARAMTRSLPAKIKNSLSIGAKTGSITGGFPYGKRDWLTAYIKPKDPALGKGISISIMNVNVKKWYVKSTFLANRLIRHYFNTLQKENRMLSKTEDQRYNDGV